MTNGDAVPDHGTADDLRGLVPERILLDSTAWDEFIALLAREPSDLPELTCLLWEPAFEAGRNRA